MMSEYDFFTPDPEAVKAWVEKHLMPKRAPVLVWRGQHPDVAKGADGKMFTMIPDNVGGENHDRRHSLPLQAKLKAEGEALIKEMTGVPPVLMGTPNVEPPLPKVLRHPIFTKIKPGMKVYQPEWSRSYEVKSIDPVRKTITLHTYGGGQALYFWQDLQNLAIAP